MQGIWRSALAAGIILGAGGCAALRYPVIGTESVRESREITLLLHPSVLGSQGVQAAVKRWTVTDIHRLDIVPYIEVSPGVYSPLSTAGTSTTLGAPDLLRVSRMVPLNLSQPVVLSHLKPGKKYRIFAHAYTSSNALISSNDTQSAVDVAVGTDDRPTMSATLPVKLIDSPFAASTTVTLSKTGPGDYDDVLTELVSVVSGTEVPIAGSSHTVPKAQVPKTFNLAGLQAQSLYRMKATARKATSTVATASVNVNVLTDTVVAPVALTVDVPTLVRELIGKVTTYADLNPGDKIGIYGMGMTKDSQGNLYIIDATHGREGVVKVKPDGTATYFINGVTRPGGAFQEPYAVAVDSSDNIYVIDTQLPYIVKYDKNGTEIATLGSGLLSSWGLAIDSSDNIIVAQDGAIWRVASNGTKVAVATHPSYLALGVAVDDAGNIYAADSENNLVYKVPTGSSTMVNIATLTGATGVAVDAAGTVYVTFAHGIQKLTPKAGAGPNVYDSTTLAGSATTGTSDGTGSAARFYSPSGIVLGHDGFLYVMDSHNKLIRKVE